MQIRGERPTFATDGKRGQYGSEVIRPLPSSTPISYVFLKVGRQIWIALEAHLGTVESHALYYLHSLQGWLLRLARAETAFGDVPRTPRGP